MGIFYSTWHQTSIGVYYDCENANALR